MKKIGNYSPFHVNPDRTDILPDDFELATLSEKESMVETRKSVSYWADAWRRFRKNTVSMGALFLFTVLFLFAFAGPALIPYDYESQYRNSQNLFPGKYSKKELAIKSVEKEFSCFWASAMQSGSLTSISEGKYYIMDGGKKYYFSIDKITENAIIAVNKKWQNPVILIKESDISNGIIEHSTPLRMENPTAEEAASYRKLNTLKKVFPHIFGTDSSGRDLMARTMYGARVSIIIGIVAALIVLVIGCIYGAISGLIGGPVDFVMMRIVDLIYSIPEILIVLLLQVVLKDPLQNWFDRGASALAKSMSDLGTGIVSIFITFALLYWVGMARIVRGQVLQLKKQEFVTAANALGASKRRIIRRHLLPNCVGQLIIQTCLQIPSAIFLESFLSFLGLGVSAPMASLGSLCSDAIPILSLYPHRLTCPSIILTLIVLSLNLIGDGLRDALDPRLKK